MYRVINCYNQKGIKDTSKFICSKQNEIKKLLYPASENDFQVSTFLEKCDGSQHKVLLIQTQFDQKIGGYTTISWNIYGGSIKDDSKESFIFYPTHGQKFEFTKGQFAMQQYRIWTIIWLKK